MSNRSVESGLPFALRIACRSEPGPRWIDVAHRLNELAVVRALVARGVIRGDALEAQVCPMSEAGSPIVLDVLPVLSAGDAVFRRKLAGASTNSGSDVEVAVSIRAALLPRLELFCAASVRAPLRHVGSAARVDIVGMVAHDVVASSGIDADCTQSPFRQIGHDRVVDHAMSRARRRVIRVPALHFQDTTGEFPCIRLFSIDTRLPLWDR